MSFEEKYNNRDNIVVPSSNWFPDDDDIDYDEIVTTESLQEEGLKRSIQKVRKAWRKLNHKPKRGTGKVHLLFEGDIYDCGRPISRNSFDVYSLSDWEFVRKHVSCKRCYKQAEDNEARYNVRFEAADSVENSAQRYVDLVVDEFEKLEILDEADPDVLASAGLSEFAAVQIEIVETVGVTLPPVQIP